MSLGFELYLEVVQNTHFTHLPEQKCIFWKEIMIVNKHSSSIQLNIKILTWSHIKATNYEQDRNSNYNQIRGANIKDGLYSLNGPMEQKYIFTDNKLGTNPSKEKL